MSTPMTAVTNTAMAFAEEAVDSAIDLASDVASDAVDLAVPAVAYGTKRLLSSRYVVGVLLAAGALAGLFAWRRRSGNSEEDVTSSIPNISDRQPA